MAEPINFVLVHGAWHGAWCYARTRDILTRQGHRVFTPTLTGLGERSHLLSRDIDLDTHIADVVNVMRWEDLDDVVLAGHSYGGWVISGVAEQMEKRISSIVYLDAYLPEDGESGRQIGSVFTRKGLDEAVRTGAISRPGPKAEQFMVMTEENRRWVDSRMTEQPVGPGLQPIKLTGARDRIAKKTYVLAGLYQSPQFTKYHAACRKDPSWRTLEMPCGHDVMVDMPELLAEILIDAA
jgi:pimeloyl-ACP methyl ester carboxylesterase